VAQNDLVYIFNRLKHKKDNKRPSRNVFNTKIPIFFHDLGYKWKFLVIEGLLCHSTSAVILEFLAYFQGKLTVPGRIY